MMTTNSGLQWSSRWIFLLAAVGTAVGLGNIWRFPYTAGVSGGGAFVIVYLGAVLLLALPLLLAEFMIGRRGAAGPPAAIEAVARESGRSRHWRLMGIVLGSLGATLSLSFYAVVGAWTISYAFKMAAGQLQNVTAAESEQVFFALSGSPGNLLPWFTAFFVATVYISSRGLHDGIEKAIRFLMPALFVMLIIMVIYAATVGDFARAWHFLFNPDFSKITTSVVMAAFGQAFFSISVGLTNMMAYAAYIKRDTGLPKSSALIVAADTLVALLAGLAIFPIIFMYGLEPGAGPGLVFMTLPFAFGQITGGMLFGTMFFVLLFFAALTSSIAMLEAPVAWLRDATSLSRRAAALLAGSVSFCLGILAALSFSTLADFHPLGAFKLFEGKTFFDVFDFTVTNVMMPIGGILIAIFAGWFVKTKYSKDELFGGRDTIAYTAWLILVRFLAPVVLTLVFFDMAFGARPADGTAIVNVTVIDAEHGVRENQTVIFRGDEITSVSNSNEAKAAAVTIDGSGKFLIPGLWDMHVHLTYDDALTEKMPEMFLAYGITSVRDTGGLMYKLLPVVEKMRAKDAIAPRVYFSGPLLDGRYVVYDGVSQPEIGISNSSVESAFTNVANLKNQGVDFIKIYEMVDRDVFAALVEAAQRYDLPVAAHIPLSMSASEAGPQVGSMEHLRNIELDCAENAAELLAARQESLASPQTNLGSTLRWSLHEAQRLPAIETVDEVRCQKVLTKLRSTIQVPTARLNGLPLVTPYDRPDWQKAKAHLPAGAPAEWLNLPSWIEPDPADRDTRYAEWSLNMIGAMNDAGIRIGAGTDTPLGVAIPGYSLHNELAMLVRAGLTPMEAIRSATITPAEFLKLDDEMGTIDVGKRADLLLLNANPLDDIENTRRIDLVVSKGSIVTPVH
jgi:NSS family neurotransmitter:Na+ symporter